MTKQHVFPDRLKHVLPKLEDPKRAAISRNRIVRRGKLISREDARKDSHGSPSQFKIRKVCERCNNGWLKKMEDDSVPVLEHLVTGELSMLTKPDQERLARLATSIAMVGEWITRGNAYTTQDERTAFKLKLYPPPGWFVFIGRNALPSEAASFGSDGCNNLGEDGRGTPKKEFSSFTFSVRQVLFHILTLPTGKLLDVDTYAAELGLASICPTTDWINFSLMPPLDTEAVTSIRAYVGMSLRKGWGSW